MDEQAAFAEALRFFQDAPVARPGERAFDVALCQRLMAAAQAEAASVWMGAREGRLRLAYGTNVAPEEVSDISLLASVELRAGEGVTGAVALSRRPIAIHDAWSQPQHDRRIDERIGFRTRSMVSAPILFGDRLYGVLNILNHTSGGAFPLEWKSLLAAIGALYGAALGAEGRAPAASEGRRTPGRASRVAAAALGGKSVIVGVSLPIREALHLCLKAARTDSPVLLRGETGTGKELAARRIHDASPRARKPFVAMNCAALTDTLLESELFGHVKGAFTGAIRDRQGKFVAASGGTLFLDEIAAMSPLCQAKILRALQEKTISPVGSEKVVTCNVRILAATNHDLWSEVQRGLFREDLYYRLCGIEILMPPLRDRMEDIPLLAMHFIHQALAAELRGNAPRRPAALSMRTLDRLRLFSWPGNVRQLEQAVMAAIALCEGEEIEPEDFPAWFQRTLPTEDLAGDGAVGKPIPAPAAGPGMSDGDSDAERERYLAALRSSRYPGTGRWNLSAASRALGLPRKTVEYRLKRMGLL